MHLHFMEVPALLEETREGKGGTIGGLMVGYL
jgi:hypothetical protein